MRSCPSPEDKPHATPEILADLAEQYLSQRAPGAMAWGRVHFDKNPHIHLVISANLRGQKKKLRLSRNEFTTVKQELEAYQKQHYPELSSSIVFDDPKKKAREVKEKTVPGMLTGKLPEQEREKRLIKQGRGVMSQKQILRRNVLEAFTGSVSLETFTARLQQRDITLYERNGRLAGVVFHNKKYRFKTLGLEETLKAAKNCWEKSPNRHKALRNILAEKARVLFREFGVPDRIKAVLDVQEGKQRAGQHPRLDAIRQILDKKRQLGGPPDRGREGF